MDEIKFYTNYLETLSRVNRQMESPEVAILQLLLAHKKKFKVSQMLKFDNFKETYRNTVEITSLMREIPIQKLLSANELKDVAESILNIWEHLQKLVMIRFYPIEKF